VCILVAGTRPQKEDAHIPSQSSGGTAICGFDLKEQNNLQSSNNCHPGLDPGSIFVSKKMDSGSSPERRWGAMLCS
jgi:hypothetical protein